MSPSRYGFHEVVSERSRTQRPTVTDHGRVMRSYPVARSHRYRCGYSLFRNVFSEQITFCFENLTVLWPRRHVTIFSLVEIFVVNRKARGLLASVRFPHLRGGTQKIRKI